MFLYDNFISFIVIDVIIGFLLKAYCFKKNAFLGRKATIVDIVMSILNDIIPIIYSKRGNINNNNKNNLYNLVRCKPVLLLSFQIIK